MNARLKFYLDLEDAARIVYPPGWRNPPPENSIERDRYDEARREYRESRYDYEEMGDE